MRAYRTLGLVLVAVVAIAWTAVVIGRRSTTVTGTTIEAQLASHLAEGIALYDRDLRSDALVRYPEARDLLRRAGSPAWLTAELNIGIVANQQRRPPA